MKMRCSPFVGPCRAELLLKRKRSVNVSKPPSKADIKGMKADRVVETLLEDFQSDFERWVSGVCAQVRKIGYGDRFRGVSGLSSEQIVQRVDSLVQSSNPDFPPECPVSAGEGAFIKTSDGKTVAVFVEGWSSTCLGDNDPSEVLDLGNRVLARWDREVDKKQWKRVIEEPFTNGLTLLVCVNEGRVKIDWDRRLKRMRERRGA
jgi:hypothetical protein